MSGRRFIPRRTTTGSRSPRPIPAGPGTASGSTSRGEREPEPPPLHRQRTPRHVQRFRQLGRTVARRPPGRAILRPRLRGLGSDEQLRADRRRRAGQRGGPVRGERHAGHRHAARRGPRPGRADRADLIVGTGPGSATAVVAYDGVSGAELFRTAPFEASFTGSVNLTAGELNGDGTADVIVTPDEGGGPRVDVHAGGSFAKFASFFGIDDTSFRGGARAGTGDLNGDGRPDLIVVAGFGGGPRVAGFNGESIGGIPSRLFGDFFAFEQALRNGIFVAVGDVDGDGYADLICDGGPGGGPRVTVFGGKPLQSNNYDVRANFFGGDNSGRGGIRVTAKDLDGDERADIVVGAGSRTTAYFGKDIPPAGTPAEAFAFDAFSGFDGGVFVG